MAIDLIVSSAKAAFHNKILIKSNIRVDICRYYAYIHFKFLTKDPTERKLTFLHR